MPSAMPLPEPNHSLPVNGAPDPSQDRFRTVFENSPLGQKIITPDLVIQQANAAAAALLGLGSPAELVGRRILEFTHPHFRADWHELQERLWKHKTPHFSLETCLVRVDGSSFWCQVHSILFPDEGGELGYTLLEDISERKKLEDSRQRLYDTQETILHLAAHDLRTPLAAIQLLTDLLERETAAPGPGPAGASADTRHYLALIKQSCAEADALIQDVLYLGILETNELEKQPTNLSVFLAARLNAHRLLAREKGITLTLEAAEPVTAHLHPDTFGRVLDNLLSNALKFTPTGGRVVMAAGQHEDRVRLRVQDNGIGIPASLQAQVFDKFNPARRGGLRGEPTTGLGLFIARQIVELHGGHIWLESREQEGTTFFIDLPSDGADSPGLKP